MGGAAAEAVQGHGTQLALTLFVMFAAAKLCAEIFLRLRQPAVIGEIVAGIVIGPEVLGWVHPNAASQLLSEIGVVFLLFSVGLETKPATILKVGVSATIVAVLGVIAPLVAGYALMSAFGYRSIEALFVGTTLVATSVGITAKVLGDLGQLEQTSARIILGAAVIDDVLGLLVLAAVSSAAGGVIDYAQIALTALLAIGFVIAAALVAAPVLTRSAPHFQRLHLGNEYFAIAMLLCLGLAWAAAEIGVAAIVGAFLAGMAFAEAGEERRDLHQQVRGVTEFLTPFFLAGIGMQLKLAVFHDAATLSLAGLLLLLAIVTKLVGCGLGAMTLGWRGALQVGVGMLPRGAVRCGAVMTTLVAPPLLRPLYAEPAKP